MADAFTSDTYDALCQEAEGYLARGLAEQARELLLKATSLIGTRPKARSLLADACMSLGLWEEARAQLETLTTLEIDNFHNHFRLGQVLEELGENQLARDNYSVVLEHNSDHHGARVAISRLENIDETPDVNLASFFASDGSEEVEEVTDIADAEDTDSGEVVESVFGSTQVFPDDSGADDVFAGEEDVERGIDKLLKDLGVEGDTQETSGAVAELLESLGIRPDGDEEEVKEALQKVDIASLLGGDDDAENAAAVKEVTAEVKAGGEEAVILESVFAAEVPAEEPAGEEDESVVEVPSAYEEAAADVLESVFEAGAPREEPVYAEAPAAEAVQQAGEPAPVESGVGMLDSIFGAPEAPLEEAPVEEAIAEEAPVEEAVTEEATVEEAVNEEAPVEEAIAEEAPVEEAPAEEAPVEEAPAEEAPVEEAPAEETPVEEVPAGETLEPAVTETAEPEPEAPPAPEPAAEKATAGPAAGKAVFTVYRPDPESLVTVELSGGTVAVRQAFVVAMSRNLGIVADDEGRRLVSGRGTIWLGQGERVPVSIELSDGMYARSDRMVLYDAGIGLDPVDLPGAPAMVRLKTPEASEVLFFASGRMRELDLPGGASLQVRAASLLAAGVDVVIAGDPDSTDFLTLSGNGRIYISG